MRLHDIERLVGIPYEQARFDCADLVVLAQRELFGREVDLPGRRPRGLRGALELAGHSRLRATPREGPPHDGDLVLMIERGHRTPGHAGVFFFLAHEGWVLHSNETNGCSVLHRVRDLPGYGLRIEGYYAWN
ncbi:peptidoglycan endopeptidase [Stenotrophomonas sp. 24(2023)]|uniref:peptidoglycan endopeptidase n=1 Tax=Stenotrophomonas sp. 24(2023) TaxID=3068324 RepID=UPI0027E1D2DB|nr:peptidoglycan endopeptidase [Stenotrophomonas sp. 24(2023)]WMJ69976.1 peptidoglycan endopeptidase [Stenotrophomonas sp. 24(2023)]